MIVYCLVVILFFIQVGCHAEESSKPAMVADVIRAMQRPSAVIAMLCWSSNLKLQLYSALEGENVTQITMMQFLKAGTVPERHAQDQHIVFLADLDCPDIISYFQTSSLNKHFRSPFRWILIDSGNNDTSQSYIPNAVGNFDILVDSEVILAHHLGDGSYRLHLIYRIGNNTDWKKEFYGTWDERRRLQKQVMEGEIILRRIDLESYELPICYVLTDNDSINHLYDNVNDHIDTITKVNFPTTNHLLDFLNASRKYVFANTWGYRVNGTWNGMTGYLVREEVEIGGSPMFFTSERISIVDYISSPTPTRSKFVFRQPKLSYENNLFLLSFRASVWYSSIALLLLLVIVLFIVTIWEWKKTRGHEDKKLEADSGILRASVVDVVLLIFGAACQQGSTVELKGSLGRIVMLILFLALMFLYTSYSANIVALLQSSSSQIKTLEDLLHSRIKFGVHDTVFNKYYFSTATEPVRKAIYETKVASSGSKPRFMPMDEGVKKMQKGLFAFHMETGVGYKFVGKYFQESEKCGLKEIQYLQVIDPWLAVRKNTPYKEMFKLGTKRIQEHGLQSRENRLLYEKRPKCSGQGGSFVSVSMVDCYPALLVLFYGAVFSVGLLFIEILTKRRNDILRKISRAKTLGVDVEDY
ncbi:ionotropic receptor 75a-like isoform X2 [Cydia pomonella]|uniref:ionotropic receptor 75a-like isoform X2 n=1 Tax=Cydia pomonella TaxID=82600 RepID=UPI002ADE6A70|nr:ionotropic receptor 75a-like isoform X2 [Cydia pomonella]